MKRIPLLTLLIVRIVSAIKPRPELRIAEHLIRLVDLRHLLLGLLLRDALRGRFVRVVLSYQFAVDVLDGAIVCVAGNAEHFVIIFLFRALELDVRLVEHLGDVGGAAVVFFGRVEGGDGGVVVLGVELALGLGEEAMQRLGVEGEGFGAEGDGFAERIHLAVGFAGGFDEAGVEGVGGGGVYVASGFGFGNVVFEVLQKASVGGRAGEELGDAVESAGGHVGFDFFEEFGDLLLPPSESQACFRVRVGVEAFRDLSDSSVCVAETVE